MKVAALFSGGKDSTFAAWLAKKQGHDVYSGEFGALDSMELACEYLNSLGIKGLNLSTIGVPASIISGNTSFTANGTPDTLTGTFNGDSNAVRFRYAVAEDCLASAGRPGNDLPGTRKTGR